MLTYKIVADPTQMRVECYAYKSDPIDIGDEHISTVPWKQAKPANGLLLKRNVAGF